MNLSLMEWSGRAPAPPAIEAGPGASKTRSTPCLGRSTLQLQQRINLSQCGNWKRRGGSVSTGTNWSRERPNCFIAANPRWVDSDIPLSASRFSSPPRGRDGAFRKFISANILACQRPGREPHPARRPLDDWSFFICLLVLTRWRATVLMQLSHP
jgi:hypothetical protein